MRRKKLYVKKVLWKFCKQKNLLVPREFCSDCEKRLVCDSPDVIKKIKKVR